MSARHKCPSYFLQYTRWGWGGGCGKLSSIGPSYPELERWVKEVLILFMVRGPPSLPEHFGEQEAALLGPRGGGGYIQDKP